MSSRLTTIRQQDLAANYFLCTLDTNFAGNFGFYPENVKSTLKKANETLGIKINELSKDLFSCETFQDIQNYCDFLQNSTTNFELSRGMFFKDMGKKIDFTINGQLTMRYQLVQLVSGATVDGNSGKVFYVPVYVSIPFNIYGSIFIPVARVGAKLDRSSNNQFLIVNDTGFQGYAYKPSSIENGLSAVESANIKYLRVGNNIYTKSYDDMKSLYNIVFDMSNQYETIYPGDLFRDLGKTVDFTVNGALAIRWQLFQRVAGADTEGVPDVDVDSYGNVNGVYYIPTFVADQDFYDEHIVVSRTGSRTDGSPETKFFVNRVEGFQFIHTPENLESGLVDATNGGVSFNNSNGIIQTKTLPEMITLYNYLKQDGIGNVPYPIQFRDLGKNIDFMIDGRLAIRWRKVQYNFGPSTEGDSLYTFNEHSILYIAIYISDPSVFGEEVIFSRVG